MALRLGSLYDALRQAEISEESARAAAEEVAAYENRIAKVEERLTVLTWMVGVNIGLTLLVLGRLFTFG